MTEKQLNIRLHLQLNHSEEGDGLDLCEGFVVEMLWSAGVEKGTQRQDCVAILTILYSKIFKNMNFHVY